MRRTVLIWLAAVASALALVPAAAHAQTLPKQPPRASLIDIEHEVQCVVCGRPLSTSGGTAADDERAEIQAYIDRGMTKSQIKEQLVREYGKAVLTDDSSPIAGAAPIIAAVVGALAVALLLRRRLVPRDGDSGDGDEHEGPGARQDAPEPSDDDLARVDAELAQRD